jgi:hypothetical protein
MGRTSSQRSDAIDPEERYPDNWDQIQPLIMASTGGLCSYPHCWEMAVDAHHAIYFDKEGLQVPIGQTGAGTRFFPLCHEHHNRRTNQQCAHHSANWYRGSGKNKNDACNRPHYYKLLRAGWQQKVDWLRQQQSQTYYR